MEKTRGKANKAGKKLFTVEEYHRIVEAGALDEGNKVELIEGEIYPMAAMGSLHAACVDRLNKFFAARVGDAVIVRVQCPVELDDASEPEPDVSLLKFREDFYAGGHPKPSDILLAVEVSDTTLAFDTNVKLPTYARTGIPEVWIADLRANTIRIHTNLEDGEYRKTSRAKRGESFESGAVPGGKIAVKSIIG
jgi:Uma2 family endonuclease